MCMIRKYHNHNPQKNPWYRKEEPHNRHETPRRQTKQSNQLSLPEQDDRKIRMDKGNVQQNIEQLQTHTMGVTINNKSTATEPPPNNGRQSKPPAGGIKCILLVPNLRPIYSHSCRKLTKNEALFTRL